MKFARQVIEIKRDSVRLMGGRAGLDDPRVLGYSPHQSEFRRVGKAFESRTVENCRIGEIGR